MDQQTKTCIRCGKRKRIKMFGVRSDNGKRRNTCKACIAEMARIRRQAIKSK